MTYRTAITRTKPSRPAKFLADRNLLVGRTLDYGCGKGFDADYYSLEKYDPHFYPRRPKGKYDTIICNYVLNVIQESEQETVMNDVRKLLRKGGKAYYAVRRDIPQDGVNSRGTYQRTVYLEGPGVRLLIENSGYALYGVCLGVSRK